MKSTRVLKSLTLGALIVAVSACGFVGKPMPADYPLPLYPGATAQADGYHEVMGTRSLVLDCTAAPEKIAEFYKGALEKGGWQNVKSQQTGPIYIVQGTKGGADSKTVEAANIQVQPRHIILTYLKR